MPEWLGLTAAGGLIFAAWNYVRSILIYVRSLGLVTVEMDDEIGNVFSMYLLRNFKILPLGQPRYVGETFYDEKRHCLSMGFGEGHSRNARLYFRGWRFCWISREYGGDKSRDLPGLVVTYIRGMFNIEQMLHAAVEDWALAWSDPARDGSRGGFYIQHHFGTFNEHRSDRAVSDNGSVSAPDASIAGRDASYRLGVRWLNCDLNSVLCKTSKRSNAAEHYAFTTETRSLREDFDRWIASKDWYADRRIPWRRGYLLHGPPGTGKTSLVRMLAIKNNLPVHVLHLDTMHNRELVRNWQDIISRTPCIVLVEDLDAIFEGRETKHGGVSFDTFLNCLDGVEQTNGIVLFLTTNHPDKLDPAIAQEDAHGASRPGRIDRLVKFAVLPEDSRRYMAEGFFRDWPEEIEPAVAASVGMTGDQFSKYCERRALDIYWKEQNDAKERERRIVQLVTDRLVRPDGLSAAKALAAVGDNGRRKGLG